MRLLCCMATVLRSGKPGHVHRAGVRHRQHRSPEAGSGQEKGEREGTTAPEDAEHGR